MLAKLIQNKNSRPLIDTKRGCWEQKYKTNLNVHKKRIHALDKSNFITGDFLYTHHT